MLIEGVRLRCYFLLDGRRRGGVRSALLVHYLAPAARMSAVVRHRGALHNN